jgi:arylsulfatase A-like enzyme
MGFTRGFDHFRMINYHEEKDASSLVSELLGWRDEIVQGQPFFLYLHFMDPHAPYHRHPQWLREDAPPRSFKKLEDRAAYDSEIRLVDEQIRRLFRELPLDDALVIVTSDHGQEFGDHGSFGHGFQLYSELTQVPLLVRHPEGPTGRVSRDVSNLDVLPTLRALVGAPPSSQDRGLPLLGAGAPGDEHERAFFSMRSRIFMKRKANKRAVVRGGLKLILSEPAGEVELYDLTTDPGEQHDLAEEREDEMVALRALLHEQRLRFGSAGHEPADPIRAGPEMIEMLERLGYVEGEEP